MKNIFNFQPKVQQRGLAGVLAGAKDLVNQQGRTESAARNTAGLLTLESIDTAQLSEITTAVSNMHASMEAICAQAFPGKGEVNSGVAGSAINASQMKAGIYAAMLGGDIKAAARAPTKASVLATEGLTVVTPDFQGLEDRRFALEAYDESSTSTSVAFSIAYNLAAARQDEFSETLFPTVVIPPDQAGMMMSIDMVMLQNDAKRNISGNVTDFYRYNVIRAQIHPELLQNDATSIVPVYRTDSAQYFLPSSVVAPQTVVLSDGESITTSPLAMGPTFDLLAISQTEALLETGLAGVTDSIDPGVSLKNLYLQLTKSTTVGETTTNVTEILQLSTVDHPYTTFNYIQQGNFREQVLNFSAQALVINSSNCTVVGGSSVVVGGATTPIAAGTASTILAPLVSGSYEVRLGVSVSGKLNLQFGQLNMFASGVTVESIRAGTVDYSSTATPGSTIAALFNTAAFVGYDVTAWRSNMNRRQRGQLVDTTTYRQFYNIMLLPPVTVPRPHAAGDLNDAKDLAALVFTTHVRTSNAGVDKLLATAQLLQSIVGQDNRVGDVVETLGLARYMIDPYWETQNYNAPDVVDSISSHQRAMDIQASLVSMIRDMVYRMYQKSGFKPAADSQNGGMAAMPTVIIATDQIIARYLTVTGDMRTLGDQFPVKIVSTPNEKMYGQIYLTFGDFTTAEAGVPNVLHFGTMQWRPELTVILPTYREGQNSKEISVSPSFNHHVNLPILAQILVTNISDVVNQKVTITNYPTTVAPGTGADGGTSGPQD